MLPVFETDDGVLDCRDCIVLVDGVAEWFDFEVCEELLVVLRDKLLYVAACCIAARIDSGFRTREHLDRWSRAAKLEAAKSSCESPKSELPFVNIIYLKRA